MTTPLERASFKRAKRSVLRQLREDHRDGIYRKLEANMPPDLAAEERDFKNERRLLNVAIAAVTRVKS